MFMRRMNHLQVTYEFYTIVWRIFFKKSIAVGGLPFELRNDTSSERWNIYKEARNSIKNNNIPEMSLDEINAEISAARTAR